MNAPVLQHVSLTPKRSSSDAEQDTQHRQAIRSDIGHGSTNTKTNTLKTVKAKATTKAKNILEKNLSKLLEKDDRHRDASVGNTEDDTAFHPHRIKEHQLKHVQSDGPIDKAKVAIERSGNTLMHPRRSIRDKVKRVAAGKISTVQKPHSLPTTGAELLDAYDAYSQSEGSRSSEDVSEAEASDLGFKGKQNRLRNKARLQKLEAQRESMRVASTTRHIDRVRVVPKEHIKFPEREAFIERDDQDQVKRYKWHSWLGHVLIYYTQDFCVQYIDDFDELPFDIDTLKKHAERLVMASAPWQIWAMDVRSVYRWQDPYRSARWLVTYLILWYSNHLGVFLWACILYYTIRNKFYPSSMKHLRAAIDRSVDREADALQIGEFIDRHGREKWLDPLIEELGPYVQLQLGDIANLLEVLSNFYSWKSPRQTAASLVFFGACLLTALFADMKFGMKVFSFISGASFFLCWPISSLYPRYRYLVSPIKWVLWDIPTHAEWSFQYLRRRCQESRESMIVSRVDELVSNQPDAPILDRYTGRISVPHPDIEIDGKLQDIDSDATGSEDWHSADSTNDLLTDATFLSYRGHWDGVSGRLAITPMGIRFIRSYKRQEKWYLPYIKIEEMRKFKGAARSEVKTLDVRSKRLLQLKAIDGRHFTIDLRGDRDEVFNYIIGFSGLQWQSLQSGPQKATTHS